MSRSKRNAQARAVAVVWATTRSRASVREYMNAEVPDRRLRCPECKGKRYVWVSRTPKVGIVLPEAVREKCPLCLGDGVVEPGLPIPTPESFLNVENLVKATGYGMDYVSRAVAEALNRPARVIRVLKGKA